MDYDSVAQNGNDVVVNGITYFDLAQTLDCGQAFRWVPINDAKNNKFCGIAHGRQLQIEFSTNALTLKNTLTLKDTTPAEFEAIWKDYFGLSCSYTNLRDMFTNYDTMTKALAFSPGLRLMRQCAWETLVSFILSQNSNIPRIKKMISLLCQHFGNPLSDSAYAFPSPQAIAKLSINDLEPIRSGYRAAYIIDAAQRVAGGILELSYLATRPTEEVRAALLSVHGVGPKVADCVLLFGFGRLECFPLDVWMKRVMATLYPDGFPDGLKQYAGIAQQFLFHYARVHGL